MPWTFPPCTCPRDDSGDTRGCERHDSRSDWNTATQFYTEGIPCESCGHACDARSWDAEYELWIGLDCACRIPDVPVCPALAPLILAASTVGEVIQVCKDHRLTCSLCGAVEIRKPVTGVTEKIREAA